MMINISQSIADNRRIFNCGDCVKFVLQSDNVPPGYGAFMRTNLGNASIRRSEIIDYAERNWVSNGRDWHDIPMKSIGNGVFELLLPMLEVGVFEAKMFLKPDDSDNLYWASSSNLQLKVEPSDTVCSNIFYSAFVRQFVWNENNQTGKTQNDDDFLRHLDEQNYTVIPPSGTFRNVIKQLDFILGRLGCRILQLLPIHPTPTTYGRMGRYGSPFAALDYFSVSPALTEFDRKRTPMEQFGELIDAVHKRNSKIFMDIPVNHTGWASKVQQEHPEWFFRRQDGTLESPGAWGVVWEDLCKLNYEKLQVREYMAEVFLFWCRHGVDGFRCDAGYMLPQEAWNYIVAKVKNEYPDTIFLLEGLGGPPDKQEYLLSQSGLDWAYSELFQNYTRDQIEYYQRYLDRCSHDNGLLINYAETHDNSRLAAVSPQYSQMRCALCALLSEVGGFGFSNGVEWFATEQINVHKNSSLNWNNSENQVYFLGVLNRLLGFSSTFFAGSSVRIIGNGSSNAIAAVRTAADGKEQTLVLVNLDISNSVEISWSLKEFGGNSSGGWDFLSAEALQWRVINGQGVITALPGQALCLTLDEELVKKFMTYAQIPLGTENIEQLTKQAIDFQIWLIWREINGFGDVSELDIAAMRNKFVADHRSLVCELCGKPVAPVTHYRVKKDLYRNVMIPPGDLLCLENLLPFDAKIMHDKRVIAIGKSVKVATGYVLYLSIKDQELFDYTQCELYLNVYDEEVKHHVAPLLLLKRATDPGLKLSFGRNDIMNAFYCALATNSYGGMSFIDGRWGEISSKYNALLAGNCNNVYPQERYVMFNRCRVWIKVNDYTHELSFNCMDRFTSEPDNRSKWEFSVPVGQGKVVKIYIFLKMAYDADAIELNFMRGKSDEDDSRILPDNQPVKLILRPQLEDRINHEVTKAFAGAETSFPGSVQAYDNGFDFAPSEQRKLEVRLSSGVFVRESEWQYMTLLPNERYYGLECNTDLFSPGYFRFSLTGGAHEKLTAIIKSPSASTTLEECAWPHGNSLSSMGKVNNVLTQSLKRFIVKRDDFESVIAGYPWFLDWGRDTLICLRGYINAGYLDTANRIIRQFASFEKDGTIPNMIRGRDVSNRDTSDAPLWLFVAVRDYICASSGDDGILSEDCNGRTLKECLHSIIDNYQKGTPNQIRMDGESKLIYSPPHFTWMDTAHPVCSSREGYPIEIQSLWFCALELMSKYDSALLEIAQKVRESVEEYFYLKELKQYSDCLECNGFVAAGKAIATNAVRPNQLLAVTLGLVVDKNRQRNVLECCEELLVPGAIRSLSNRRVNPPLPNYLNGVLINDPERPYWGRYWGSEDRSRKPAYHNGTAWTWMFPSFVEALYMVGGEDMHQRALDILMSSKILFECNVPGQLPEITDGDYPHHWGGCAAQAWGVTEFYRIFINLVNNKY